MLISQWEMKEEEVVGINTYILNELCTSEAISWKNAVMFYSGFNFVANQICSEFLMYHFVLVPLCCSLCFLVIKSSA